LSEPQHYVSDKTTVYSVVELDAPALPDNFFAFSPPSTAKVVEDFNHASKGRANCWQACPRRWPYVFRREKDLAQVVPGQGCVARLLGYLVRPVR